MKRVALVTGGSRGIGFGIAQRLAAEGWDLVVCGVRDQQQVGDALKSLKAVGGRVQYVQADVSVQADRVKLIAAIKKEFGRLDALVNNAGMAPRERHDILKATEANYDEVLNVNLKGPYFLTQAVANWMIEQKTADTTFAGSIVYVTSVSAVHASVNRGEYCISKAGLSMVTKLWALRLAEHRIPVYEVRPGIVKTDMTAGVQAKYDKMIAEGLIPEGRWGTPEDIGKAVAALVRGDVPYATGCVLTVDGGLAIPRL